MTNLSFQVPVFDVFKLGRAIDDKDVIIHALRHEARFFFLGSLKHARHSLDVDLVMLGFESFRLLQDFTVHSMR